MYNNGKEKYTHAVEACDVTIKRLGSCYIPNGIKI